MRLRDATTDRLTTAESQDLERNVKEVKIGEGKTFAIIAL